MNSATPSAGAMTLVKTVHAEPSASARWIWFVENPEVVNRIAAGFEDRPEESSLGAGIRVGKAKMPLMVSSLAEPKRSPSATAIAPLPWTPHSKNGQPPIPAASSEKPEPSLFSLNRLP